MKHLLVGLLALFLAAPAVAVAQPNLSNLPANSVVGRSGIGSGPGQAIPFASFLSAMSFAPQATTSGHLATWANATGSKLADSTVAAALASSFCTSSGAVPIYSTALVTWQCSTLAGSYARWGAPGITEPTDFWITRPNATQGTLLQMQDGKGGNLRTLTSGGTGLNLQSLVDTSASGWVYSALSMDVEAQAGTSGGVVGINIFAQVNTSWTPGAGPLPGASAINTVGKSSKGGDVWGANFVGWCVTTACSQTYGVEIDVKNDIASTGQASGIWLVNTGTVSPTAGSGLLISATSTGAGFPTAGMYFSTVGGFYPLSSAATLIKSDAATIANGIDLSSLTITTSAFKSTGFNVDGSGNTTTAALSATGQIRSTFGTPTIASGACGATTNGSISGTNQSGIITIGAAATTTCTVSFSTTLANAPGACLVFPGNAAAAATGTTVARVGTPSTTAWVLTGSALASTVYSYICL